MRKSRAIALRLRQTGCVVWQAWLARRSKAGFHRPSVSARASAAFLSCLDDLPAVAELQKEPEQQPAMDASKAALLHAGSVRTAAGPTAYMQCSAAGATAAAAAVAAAAAATVPGPRDASSSAAHCRAVSPDPGCSRARPYARLSMLAPRKGAAAGLDRVTAPYDGANPPAMDSSPSRPATADAATSQQNGTHHAAPAELLVGSPAAETRTPDSAQPEGTAVAAKTASAPVAGPDGGTSSRALPWPRAKRVGSDKPQDSDSAMPQVTPEVRPCAWPLRMLRLRSVHVLLCNAKLSR